MWLSLRQSMLPRAPLTHYVSTISAHFLDGNQTKSKQRARFKALESLKNCLSRTVVVATDVAARGLDIPTVAAVIHYDSARSIDTFVHRSGRTAVRLQAGFLCLWEGNESQFNSGAGVSLVFGWIPSP